MTLRRTGLTPSHALRTTSTRVAAALIICCAVHVIIAAAPAARGRRGSTDDPAADRAGASTLTRLCSDCHDEGRILSRRTKSQWQDVLQNMADKGAQGSDEEFALVLGYLMHHYGLVNVNKAAVPELVEMLGLSDAEASAIVAYRKEHGAFKNLESLYAVPGVDRQKLDRGRDAIFF